MAKSKVSKHLEGKGLVFEVGGVKYALRAPLSHERDAASKVDSVARRMARMKDPDIQELSKLPPPEEEVLFYRSLVQFEEEQMRAEADESEIEDLERRVNVMYRNLETRTAATAVLNEIGSTARSRYLSKILLIDAEGNELDIDEQDIAVQDMASSVADDIWNDLNNIPFLSVQLSEQK